MAVAGEEAGTVAGDATRPVPVRCSAHRGYAPEYASSGAAGADLRAFLEEPLSLQPGERHVVPTGVHLEIPPGFEGQVRPRSGLAARQGITVINAPGTIDSDYRGEIMVPLVNLGDREVSIEPGDRIAQLVLAPVVQATFVDTRDLSETGRGAGGFGSTGTR